MNSKEIILSVVSQSSLPVDHFKSSHSSSSLLASLY